jgi:hypothetical protein
MPTNANLQRASWSWDPGLGNVRQTAAPELWRSCTYIYSDKLTENHGFWRDDTLVGGSSLEYMFGKRELNMHFVVCGIVLLWKKKGNLREEM